MNKAAVIKIANAVDPGIIEDRLGVKVRSLRLAKQRGVFPASWYPELRAICETIGVPCPLSAFNWKSPGASE